jgi:hypothetical protein
MKQLRILTVGEFHFFSRQPQANERNTFLCAHLPPKNRPNDRELDQHRWGKATVRKALAALPGDR